MKLLAVYRVTVFVPQQHLQGVIDGVCAVDPLRIGDYEHVMWTSLAAEQFRPLPGAVPTLGRVGALERGDSVRLEFCIPRETERLRLVLEQGIVPHHPWEIPAIFIDESWFPLPQFVAGP